MRVRRGLICLVSLAAVSTAAATFTASPSVQAGGSTLWWQERFTRSSLPGDWVDPFDHSRSELNRIYSIRNENGVSFLHARHDAATGLPSMHFGRAFQRDAAPLERVVALRWKWRVRQHPRVGNDPWADLGAALYVVVDKPNIFGAGGKGFKFAWVAKPAPTGTHQYGFLRVPMRSDPVTTEWQSESVDLCKLYRQEYGKCEGEHLHYVGVESDADNTKSVAEADFADFELVTTN